MFRLFNKRKEQKEPHYVYITVDETGDPGTSCYRGTHYVVAACVVKDKEGFQEISHRYALDKGAEEIKFHDNPDLREKILEEAEPLVLSVYYISHPKPEKGVNPSEETKGARKRLHKRMLNALAGQMIADYPVESLDVDIDESSLISNSTAEAVFEKNPIVKRRGSRCDARVGSSKHNYGLQTNDFFVGSIGYECNAPSKEEDPDFEPEYYTKGFKGKMRRITQYNRRKCRV